MKRIVSMTCRTVSSSSLSSLVNPCRTPAWRTAAIAAGPFTEKYGNKIGRSTPSGAIAEFSIPTGDSYPDAAAPSGQPQGGTVPSLRARFGEIYRQLTFHPHRYATSSGDSENAWCALRWNLVLGVVND
jgi:hypothetical protein